MSKDNDIDLERGTTASIKQHTGCQPSSGRKASRHCALAVQRFDGRAFLISATVSEDVNGDLVFSSARKQVSRVVAKSWCQRVLGRLFMNLVVGTARIKQIVHCHPQSLSPSHEGPSISPPRIYLQDFSLDPLLTEALHNPYILLCSAMYPLNISLRSSSAEHDISDVDNQSIDTCIEHTDQEIIVLRLVIDKPKLAWLLILLLLLSPALGIVVGICSRNTEAGIAASAGVFALASFVQGFVAWIQG